MFVRLGGTIVDDSQILKLSEGYEKVFFEKLVQKKGVRYCIVFDSSL